ncbi:MAG: protein TonB [Candidatus Krumholzibacteriia bacterium]
MMWRQGIPLSLLTHAFVLLMVLMFGNTVAKQPVRQPKSINVKMVRMPQTKPQEAQPAIESAPPVAQPEIKAELPPKALPEPKPEPKDVKKDPQPEIKEPEVKPTETDTKAEIADVVPQAALTVPTINGTDEDFPFSWYISLIEGKVVSQWKPRQLGFGKRAVVSCTVHFRIARNGSVSQVTLVRNSGVGVYDRESLRAVKTTRLPPLPPNYNGNSLGITFTFNLKPGT